jgi:putative transposase
VKQSKAEIYLHFVWATYERLPLVTAECEAAVYACVIHEVVELGGQVLAIGGLPDHLHLVVKAPAKHSISHLMQRAKGVSSTFARDRLKPGEFFGWQDGYAAFSISRSHLKAVVTYVRNQKRRHAENKLWPQWEETQEDLPENKPTP